MSNSEKGVAFSAEGFLYVYCAKSILFKSPLPALQVAIVSPMQSNGGIVDSSGPPKPRQIPDRKDLDFAFKGAHMSPKNDNVDILDNNVDILIEGISGFVEEKMFTKFKLDYSGFMTLVKASYIAQVTTDRVLAKFVSESMFTYYCVLVFWRRIFQIDCESTGGTELKKLSQVLGEVSLPTDIQFYLDGLGNITDSESQTWKLEPQSHPTNLVVSGGASGSYGQVNAQTHILYETIPAPIIPLLHIGADLYRTLNYGPLDWELPVNLTPVNNGDHPAGLPTSNLLGYSRAERLTDDQLNSIENQGIALNAAQNGIDTYNVINVHNVPVNQPLVACINAQLKNSKCSAPVYSPTAINGSLSQIPFTVRAPSDTKPYRLRSAVEKQGMTKSYRQNNKYIASASATFRYRFKRMMNQNTHDCFCYFFYHDNVYNIPQAWRDNENSIYQMEPIKWNIHQFGLPSQDGRGLVEAFSSRTKMKATKTQVPIHQTENTIP